jgi:alpha-galactosidase/6-phospho-beta-glucosidase family protein
MKATFVGGGSLRLLGILRGAMAEPGVLDGGEVCLYDLDPARAEAMGRMLLKTPERARAGCRVRWGTSLPRALDGADMVGVILMAGSAESFARGADACYRHGFIPSDNVSPNGAFLAIKGAPILLNLAKQMAKRCPKAMLVDFANPVAVLSGMLNNHTATPTLGVCAGYTNHQWDLARILGTDEQRVDSDVDVAGINHLSFIVSGTVAGRDLLATLRRRTGKGWKPPKLSPTWPATLQKSIPAGLRVVVRFLHELDALIFSTEPDGMMHLHYDEVLAEQLRTFRPRTRSQLAGDLSAASAGRAAADQQFRSHLDRDLDAAFWTDGWRQPGCAWVQRQDQDIFVQVLAGLSGTRRVKVVTSRPNGGAIDRFADRTVVEYSQFIEHGTVTAAGRAAVPPAVHGMIAALADHQTLLGDALASGDPKLLAQALLSYPVQPYSRAARKLYRDLAAINQDQMPASLRRVAEFL